MRRSVLVKVPSFSSAGLAGNTTFGKLAGLAEEAILHNEKRNLREALRVVVRIGIRDDHVLAHDVQRLQLAIVAASTIW